VGRSLDDRACRLEEQAEWQETADRLEKDRTFREAISRLSTSELRAMSEYMASTDRDEWAEEDKPLMLRLLGLMEEIRREGAGARGETVDPPWLSEIKGEE
jgi:cobalamin biosynthesis Mg chelatase CobN